MESDENVDKVDWIVYLKDGTPIGNIAAEQVFPEINAIDIIFNLHPNYWGNGYIKEGCIEVMRYLFSLGFDNILCDYDEGNYKSQRVNEKLGFKPYLKKENSWIKDGISITTYTSIMSKEDFQNIYGKSMFLK